MPRLPRKKAEDDYALVISQNIITYRKLKGLTQTELARRIGFSRAGLADIEAGRNKVYGDTIVRIAKALGVSGDELLGLAPSSLSAEDLPSLRFLKRLQVIEAFPEAQKKRILRNLDDAIDAQTHKAEAET